MKRSRLFLAFALVISLVAAPSLTATARAANVEDCRIPSGEWSIVSLGFPLRKERLGNIQSAKILVIPYQLKGEPAFSLSASDISNFSSAAQDIRDFSLNRSNVQFIYNKTVVLPQSALDLDDIKRNVSNTWAKDFANSTWGFITKTIKDSDSTIDYSGVDAVFLYGGSSIRNQEIAEAMMFSSDSGIKFNPDKSDGGKWFDPIKTNEGQISNVVLMYNNWDKATITHEIMHLYGLTDLYGSDTGPGRLSLMASNAMNLLSYEKWVLGWLPSSDVQCFTNVSSNSIQTVSLDNSVVNQVVVIRTSEREDYVIETTKVYGKRYVAFYSLDNNLRPPLTLFQERRNGQAGGVEIEDHSVIGTQLRAPKFTLLVGNLDSKSISLHLAPASITSSNEFQELVSKSTETKSKITQEVEAKARQEAEQRAAAEAQAAAELKAKQEVEAKIAADLKAQQEAAAKLAATKKKSTITCVKGKTTKKVTAISPKCPSGYKKK
jgi:DNA-binding protein H-NS